MAKAVLLAVLTALLAVLAYRLLDLCNKMGIFRELDPIEPANCHLIKGIEYGSKDITILPGGLALISSTLHVGTAPDNLEVDPKTGDVWIGSCPDLWKLVSYNPEKLPGSEITRIENILSKDPKMTQVYLIDGSVLQGTSVVTVYKEKLLLGTIFHKAVYIRT